MLPSSPAAMADWQFVFAMAAHNLIRLPKLLAASVQ
jgi:hypothetical protein